MQRALGLWASDSIIGETVLCAAGYALCLFLIYRLVSAYSTRLMGLAAAAVGFVLQARFYKWYAWLIPLATAWALDRYIKSSARRRWVIGCGLIVGLGWLFRLDMGTLVFGAAAMITAGDRIEATRLETSVGWFEPSSSSWPLSRLGRWAGSDISRSSWGFMPLCIS